ncbi:MAG: hypothetical protein R3E18_13030 [Sphingomonadaceae bacterium]|nr:hypothetical protein [Sphingomonadaceae bacterium]
MSLRSFLSGWAAAFVFVLTGFTTAHAQTSGLSNSYLAGTWKDDRSCRGADAMSFDAFGNAVLQGTALNYSVTGVDQITLIGSGGSTVIRSQRVDQDTMLLDYGGSRSPLYRCTAAASAPTTAVPSFTPTPAFVVGTWTDSNNCADTFTFVGNGDMLNNRGLKVGQWLLSGNRLTLALTSGTIAYDLTATDANSMTGSEVVASGFGKASFMKRCGGGGGAAYVAPAPGYSPGYALPALSSAFLVGKWKDNGLCLGKTDVEFTPTSQVSFKRTAFVNYAVTGPNMITMSGPGGSLNVTITILEPGKIGITDGSGSWSEVWRC